MTTLTRRAPAGDRASSCATRRAARPPVLRQLVGADRVSLTDIAPTDVAAWAAAADLVVGREASEQRTPVPLFRAFSGRDLGAIRLSRRETSLDAAPLCALPESPPGGLAQRESIGFASRGPGVRSPHPPRS